MGRRRGRRGTHDRQDAESPEFATGNTAASDAAPAPAPENGANGSGDVDRRWIDGLARIVRLTDGGDAGAFRTSLSAHSTEAGTTLFVPPEMPTLQPRSLRYLESLATRSGWKLVEDRRQNRVSPLSEQRDGKPPTIALGLAMLMKQTGLPGPTAMLSRPHRLSADSPLIDLPELIDMAAHAVPKAKRIVLLPNPSLVDVLHGDTLPIPGYAARVDSASTRTVLSHFNGSAIRCIGYSTGKQYVMHLLLAGGPLRQPALWTHPHTLTRTDIRFRLFRGRNAANDFGLLYSTFYYDLEQRKPQPWWLSDTGADEPRQELEAAG